MGEPREWRWLNGLKAGRSCSRRVESSEREEELCEEPPGVPEEVVQGRRRTGGVRALEDGAAKIGGTRARVCGAA